jgi:glycosyltransferase involved in cell wall biosynthesis
MLVVADINTIWRSRPFAALGELRPVLGLKPQDPLTALKQRRLPFGTQAGRENAMKTLSVVLPPGWATRCAVRAMPKLWAAALQECGRVGRAATGLMVTSPHYAPLVESVNSSVPTYYYCSDDYQNYSCWSAEQMRDLEAAVVRRVCHSFFVSAALRDRAIHDYGVERTSVSVSMNATESRFLMEVPTKAIEAIFSQYPRLKRPVVGVIGGVNDRLDFSLLREVADVPDVGTLLFVGAASQHAGSDWLELLKHRRVVAVGRQPHDDLAAWQQLLDVALIPYRKPSFNHFCSPMRLFDHLAAGKPMVATDACAQVREFEDFITIASSTEDFVAAVKSGCSPGISCELAHRMKAAAAEQLWSARARVMDAALRR